MCVEIRTYESERYGMRALVPIANGSEDIEVVAIADVLARGDIEVVLATVEPSLLVQLMKGIRIQASCELMAVADEAFDAIVVPGGVPGSFHLGQSETLRKMLVAHHRAGAVVAAVCLAPALVLEPAGVLAKSDRATCNPLQISTPTETFAPDHFTSMLGEKFDGAVRVCVDEPHRIVTSQAPGTTIEFALAVVNMLRGPKVASEIAAYLKIHD